MDANVRHQIDPDCLGFYAVPIDHPTVSPIPFYKIFRDADGSHTAWGVVSLFGTVIEHTKNGDPREPPLGWRAQNIRIDKIILGYSDVHQLAVHYRHPMPARAPHAVVVRDLESIYQVEVITCRNHPTVIDKELRLAYAESK